MSLFREEYTMYLKVLVSTVFVSMLGCAESITCPDDWTHFQDSCYLFGHGQHVSFYQAEHICRQLGGKLVEVNSDTVYDFLKRHIGYFQVDRFWIGLTDEIEEGKWRWVDTNETAVYTKWSKGEPNGHTRENCAEITPTGWNDAYCSGLISEPLCEIRESENGIVGKKRIAE